MKILDISTKGHLAPKGMASVSGVRCMLRDGTHAEHVRLNQHGLLRGITRSGYPLSMYQLVLAAYFHFYGAVETAIDRSLSEQGLAFSYEPRRKLQWISEDLSFFGINPDDEAYRPNLPISVPGSFNVGELVGVLYTIEGSSLGGQVIARHLETYMGLTPEKGARFFYGYGQRIPALWDQFQVFMDETLVHDEMQNAAINSAKSTFVMMESILDDYLKRHAN